jgi:hypothetical protein
MTRLRATTVFSSPGLTITAIESVAFRVDTMGHARWMTGHLEPIAVIVKEPGRTIAFDTDGQTVDVDRLDLPADFVTE